MSAFEQYDRFVRLTSDTTLAALVRAPATSSDLIGQRRVLFDAVNGSDPVTGMMHLDLKTSLPESLLLLTDSMSMAVSLEARVPLLDHELVEAVAATPAALKIKGLRLRHMQKRMMRGHLPREVFQKRKWGFGCPMGRWFRRELKQFVRDILAPERLRRDGLFEPAAVEAIIAAHESYSEDHSDLLLALLTFQLWNSDRVRS